MSSRSAAADAGDEPDQTAASVPDLHCLAVPASVDRLPRLRRTVARWAASTGIVAELVQEVVLACYEAMANVVAHAYRDLPVGVLELHASYRADERQITIAVADHGHWRLPGADHADARLLPGGRGLILIRALAERTTIDTDDNGTVVRMRWRIP